MAAVEVAYNKGRGGFWGGLGAKVQLGQAVEVFDRFFGRTVLVQDSGKDSARMVQGVYR